MILEKIDAKADAQTVARVLESFRREVEVDLRLDSYRATKEKSIAYMCARQHVVVVTAVTVLQSSTEEYAVLLNVVTTGSTNSNQVSVMLPVIIAQLGKCQQVLLHHKATTSIDSQMELFGLTADVETRHRGSQIEFPLFKLCV